MSFEGLSFCSDKTMNSNENTPTKRHIYCVICLTRFTTKLPELIPRNLNCAHYFCTGCLLKLQEYQGDVLECPTCKLCSVLPETSVIGLEKNYDILLAAMETNKKDVELCNFCIRKLVYPPRPVTLNCFDCGVLFCGVCSDEIHKELEFRSHNVCLATVDLEEIALTRPSTGTLQRNGRPMLKRYNSSLDSIPECAEHKEKLKLYCNDCKTVCCTYCQIDGKHKGHKSFHLHEAEDMDKRSLYRLQQKVDDYGEKFIKSRSDVQKAIEAVKKNDVQVKDLIRRYFRELKTAIENTEATILQEVGRRNKLTLRSLNEQLSAMIEISSQAKSASRRCDGILNLSYFEMVEGKSEVEQDIKDVLNLECKTAPCAATDLQCQFPNHESLINQLLTCAKIVAVPEAPGNLSCTYSMDSPPFITVEWSPPSHSPYTYPTIEYILQSDTGHDNTFLDIYKGPITKVMVNSENGNIISDMVCQPPVQDNYRLHHRVQFRVAAINIIGQSLWSSPMAIRLPVHQH